MKDLKITSKLDTVYNSDSSYAIGQVYQSTHSKGHQYGFWREFYKSGNPKAVGLVVISFTEWCGALGPIKNFYNYKTGLWVYYHKNGGIKAKGNYETKIIHFENNCQGGENKIMHKVGSNWASYNEKKERIRKIKKMVIELEAPVWYR